MTDDIGRELAARAANDWKHAEGFFAVVEADVRLGAELVLLHRLQEPGELDRRRRSIGLPPIAAGVSLLAGGEIVPFGPDRQDHPLMRWP